MVHTSHRSVRTRGQGDAHDITGELARAVRASGLSSGVVAVFVTGSTAGVTTLEFEDGVVSDFDGALERIAPRDADYRHHLRWGDDNGSAHVRSGLVGPSLVVPFVNGELVLGTWQQVVLLEFDTRPRNRDYVLQVIGE